MRRFQALLVAGITVFAASAVLAQGPPGGGGAGGFNMGAFQKWRDQHKYTFQLRTMVTRGLMECNRSKSTELKPDQAKKVLDALKPLRKQPKLTQDQAKGTIKKLQGALEPRQMTAMDKAVQASARRPGGGGPGGGGPGGGGPPGGGPPGGGFGGGPPGGGGPGGAGRPGGGGPGGGRPGMNFAQMKDFNPFNADPKSPGYERNKDRNDKLFAYLEARAAGKAATLDIPQGFGGGGGRGGPGSGGPSGGAPGRPGGGR